MRATMQVRPAVLADVPDLVRLVLAARAEAGTGVALCTDDVERLEAQLGAALELPGAVVAVALKNRQVAGMLMARIVGPSVFTDQLFADLEALYVSPAMRRHGLGHALVGQLVAVAQDRGVTQVYSAPLPGSRGVQRFLARLGFEAAAGHRVSTVEALQRRLDDYTWKLRRSLGEVDSNVGRLIAIRRRTRSTTDQDWSTNMQVSLAVATNRPDSSSTLIS